VLARDSFYYKPAIYDPSSGSLAVISLAFDGDVSSPGWTPDGQIVAAGDRYVGSLWRYRPHAATR
jgi:hypothetical protein